MCPVDQELRPLLGSRVIQIPLEWRSRCGTVLSVSPDDPPTAFFIGWDDGRQEWIREEELVPQRIWLIRDEGVIS
jgi:hypothetical protein